MEVDRNHQGTPIVIRQLFLISVCGVNFVLISSGKVYFVTVHDFQNNPQTLKSHCGFTQWCTVRLYLLIQYLERLQRVYLPMSWHKPHRMVKFCRLL